MNFYRLVKPVITKSNNTIYKNNMLLETDFDKLLDNNMILETRVKLK